MFPELNLEGNTAIVTGGGRGIGRAIALVLAEAGADVVVAARTVSEIEAVAKEVRALGRQAIAVPTDVSRSSEVDALVAGSLEHFGKVDILVNNAGAILKAPVVPYPDVTLKPPWVSRESSVRVSDEEWQTVIDSNLNSVFYGCRAVAPHMLERRYGRIINISSQNAAQAFTGVSAYNASKAAVNMLTRVLALEWAPYNVRVNAIGPGDYHTTMTDASWVDPEMLQKTHIEDIPMGRGGDLRELGLMTAYLASPAADYMTGQIVYVDGGRTAR